MKYLGAFFTALALSLIFIPAVIKAAYKYGYVAQPNRLRWHKQPTALLGGAGIYAAFVLSTLFFVKIDKTIGSLLTGTTLIFVLGLIDDLWHITPQLKVIGQIFVSCILMALGISFDIGPFRWAGMLLSTFWIVGITNAFNLLDNMDGLSCGIAFIVSSFLFVYSFLNEMYAPALCSIIIAGASLGFLRYNFSPAKIFMGDCGSQFLGLTLAVISVIGTSSHISNLLVTLAIPVLILGVPIFDTTFVTFVRKLKGQPISQGGRDHTSHRLVLLGMSERKTVLFLYLLSFLFGLMALLYARIDIIIVSILAVLTVIILFFFGVFLGETRSYTDKQMEQLRHIQKEKTVLNTFILHKRSIAAVIIDLVLICIAYYLAHFLRFEGNISDANVSLMVTSLPWLIAARLGCFYYFGLYQGIWRYIGLKDLLAIFKAVAVSSVLVILFLTLFFRFNEYSRVVFIIDAVLILCLASGTRIFIRVLRESFVFLQPGEKKVLIFGAGDAGEIVLREIRNNKRLNYQPLGFLDDNPKKVGRKIHGVAVLGTRENLPQIVRENKIEEIVIAMPSATQDSLEAIFQECRKCAVPYKRMKGILWE